MTKAKMRRLGADVLVHLVLVVLLGLSLVPTVELVFLAGKTGFQFDAHPWGLTFPYHYENYLTMAPAMLKYVLNNIIIVVVAVSLAVALSSWTAYVFARFAFAAKEVLFVVVIGLLLVPGILNLIPQYLLILKLGLINTRWALIFPYAAGGTVFGVFLVRPFMAGLAEEVFEAARVDGAGDWQVFCWLALPLSAPILTTLAIMLLLGQWNDVIWPSVAILDQKLYTVSLGVWSMSFSVMSVERTKWGLIFAAFVLASLPIFVLFALARNLFIRGLSTGALKM